jgi:hypothetical protein
MGGFRLDRLNGDAGGSQKVSDVRFRFRDRPLPLPRHAEHGFVDGDRGVSTLPPTASAANSISASGSRVSIAMIA